jgi:hypothetical protein
MATSASRSPVLFCAAARRADVLLLVAETQAVDRLDIGENLLPVVRRETGRGGDAR